MKLPPDSIRYFRGKYAFLSNFYPVRVKFHNIIFPTVEHAYQAAKSKDPEVWEIVAKIGTPTVAKTYGQTIKLRKDWEVYKSIIMLRLLRRKFKQAHLRQALIDTGNVLIQEGNNWHDNFWGVCYCSKCANKFKRNQLGLYLMNLRHKYQTQ